MTTAVSKIKAINPQSLKEAIKRPDKLRWVVAIQEELESLQKAGTWKIVERPKEKKHGKKRVGIQDKKGHSRKGQTLQGKTCCQGFHTSILLEY